MIPMWQLVVGIGFGLVTALFLRKQRLTYSHGDEPRGREREGRTGGDCGGGDFSSRPRNRRPTRFNSKPGDSCVICLMEMHNDDMVYMRCGHALHDECYQSCRQHTKQCPVCRMAL